MKATAALTLLLALATLPLAAKPTTPRTATQRAAEEADANGPLSQSVWGICAVNAKGDTLAWLNASRRMVPASNMKLITTGAALLTFGGDYTYKTRFATDGEVQDSVLIGNLYIVGGGDPMIGNLFSYLPSTESTFRSWFKVLRSNGIKHITGDIVGDGRYFDAIQRHDDWSVEDVDTRDGVVPSGLTWRGKMKDTIPDGPYPAALHFLEWLRTDSTLTVAGCAREGTADSLVTLGEVKSRPLRSLVRTANCQSDNFIAETLAKSIGMRYAGDDEYMVIPAALRKSLSPIGLAAASGRMRFADGSGLSRKNYISPSFMVRYLLAMMGSKVYRDFFASLPCAGQKNTTLSNRMPNAPGELKDRIHMKSGSMNGINCLSGYIVPGDGDPSKTIAFSILSNNSIEQARVVYQQIDALLETLANENR